MQESKCDDMRHQQEQRILELEDSLISIQRNTELKLKSQNKSKNNIGKMQLDLHKLKDNNLILKEQLKDFEYKYNLVAKEKQDLIEIIK